MMGQHVLLRFLNGEKPSVERPDVRATAERLSRDLAGDPKHIYKHKIQQESVRGRSASSDVSSDISPSPLYIPPHRR